MAKAGTQIWGLRAGAESGWNYSDQTLYLHSWWTPCIDVWGKLGEGKAKVLECRKGMQTLRPRVLEANRCRWGGSPVGIGMDARPEMGSCTGTDGYVDGYRDIGRDNERQAQRTDWSSRLG